MNKRKRLLSLLMAAALFCTLLAGINVLQLKADTTDDSDVFSSEESYLTKSFADLNDSHDLSWTYGSDDSAQIAVNKDDSDGGLMITGSSDVLNQVKFTINRQFQFDGNKVCRVALDALAGKGLHVKVDCYLDHETDPFASFTLYQQGRSDLWTREKALAVDLREMQITGTHTLSFTLTTEDTGSVAVLLRSIEFVEDSVPSVYMNIDESNQTINAMLASNDASVECTGEMQIVTDESSDAYDLTYMKGCGITNLWSMADKKQFLIKLEDQASLLGMDAGSYWALSSSRPDASRLKNMTAYSLGKEIDLAYTPTYVPVELICNSEYMGMYYLTESFVSGENPDGIEYILGKGKKVSAYSLSGSTSTASEYTTITTDHSMIFSLLGKYNGGNIDAEQYESIKQDVQKTEDALFGDNFKDESGVSYQEYVDVDSAVKYFWMQQLFNFSEAFNANDTYLYKKDGKICFGPLGDFSATTWNENDLEGFNSSSNVWFNKLRQDPEFVEALTAEWPDIYEKVIAYCADQGQVDQYYDQLAVALRYDYDKWGLDSSSSSDEDSDLDSLEVSSSDQKTIADAKDDVRSYLKQRAEWINDNLEELQISVLKVTFKADGNVFSTVNVAENSVLDTIPDAPAKEGYYCKGWRYYDADSEGYAFIDEKTTFKKDTVAEAYYISSKDLVTPKNLYLPADEVWITVTEFYPFYTSVYPANAYDTNVTCTSNNPNSCIFDDEDLFALKVGEYTITFKCGTLSRTCKVHVLAANSLERAKISLKNSSLSLNVGQWKQIELNYSPAIHELVNYKYYSSDSSIATVDECGVVMAKKAGTTTIIVRDIEMDQVLRCKITVKDPSKATTADKKATTSSVKKGSTFTRKGLKYKVTTKAKNGGNVTVVKTSKKSIRSISVPSTVKYKGETYKVTGISAKAFYKCKKLKKITLGKYLKSIGNKAFKNISKKAVFKVPSSKKKAYKKLLTKKKGFRKTMRVK